MNAIKLILKELDAEETTHPKRIMIDVLTLREAAAELARLQRIKAAAREYIESSGKLARMEKYEALAAALKGETK